MPVEIRDSTDMVASAAALGDKMNWDHNTFLGFIELLLEEETNNFVEQDHYQYLPHGVTELPDGEQRSNLNIKDVIEAISAADPDAAAALEDAMARPPAPRGGPFVRIVEQPASKALRFRYECEGRSAGSIPGVNSTAERKTYPTIEICGHTGKAIIVVSCVTRDEPYKPHPHNLVGRERCKAGVCTVKQDLRDSALVSFSNLGIQCVKRRDIADALRVREGLRVDPFRTGFAHMNQPQGIDLNAVRLCFQVFLQDEAGAVRPALQPAVSEIIYDKKAMSDLQILRISRPSGPAKGNTEVILLCEKVTREDISVVLYEEGRDGAAGWEESANIIIVHKQVAIAFNTPPYRNPHTQDHREVFIQLKRVSDGIRSNSIPYTYIPEYQDTDYLKRKRQKTPLTILQQIEKERQGPWMQEQMPIKAEPSDSRSPRHMGGSPQRYTPLEHVQDVTYQQWMQEPMQGISMAGPSTMTSPPYYTPQEPWPGPSYVQPVQMQPRSPNMQANMPVTSPNMHANMPVTSPNMHANMPVTSPNMHANMPVTSPNMQGMSPMHAMSPNSVSPNVHVMHTMQTMSPGQALSPQVMSPHMMDTDRHGMSPGMAQSPQSMGHVSPNVVQQSIVQQQQQMDGNSIPSFSNLLTDGAAVQFNSGDLSNLSALLGQSYRPNELSDSLNRLSTGDLYPLDM